MSVFSVDLEAILKLLSGVEICARPTGPMPLLTLSKQLAMPKGWFWHNCV